MIEVLAAVLVLSGIVGTVSMVILLVRSRLMGAGVVQIDVNRERTIPAEAGSNLLRSLAKAEIRLPAVCGGRGTCGHCRIRIVEGGGPVLPTESALMTRGDLRRGARLACQVILRGDVEIEIPEELLGVRRSTCRVCSNRNVATFIKEMVLELPEDDPMKFRAGAYILVDCPPCEISFEDFEIDAPFRGEWDRHNLWRHRAGTREPVTRAYSLANYPEEKASLILNVRIATPPPGSPEGVPAGIVSSYLFSRKEGDAVSILGPYGTFFVKGSSREMIFLGGGAGMAPMRSHILDQLKCVQTRRAITFWYGGRSLNEVFYVDEFNGLEAAHDNFRWSIVLSEPRPEDRWDGYTGFLHQAAYDHYLKDHPAPEDCEYYICGPPMMNRAVLKMLDDLGVDPDHIMLDDFHG